MYTQLSQSISALFKLIHFVFFLLLLQSIVDFANSLTTCLLLLHYLSLVLLELRHLQTSFMLEVIRTTDGERRFYNIGDLRWDRYVSVKTLNCA